MCEPTWDMTISLTACGSFCMPSTIYWEPMLEVMIRMAFLKDTLRPWLSVTCPSSRICSRMLNTSAWAFSTSSNRMTAYGRRLQPNEFSNCALKQEAPQRWTAAVIHRKPSSTTNAETHFAAANHSVDYSTSSTTFSGNVVHITCPCIATTS